ncbi:MAG TPA: N-acetyltransferase [Candidatus Binatia bacterium]|nr:N-acetyltransferase [Candidatus Binatia bacterium]
MITVRTAKISDRDPVINVIVRAFSADPVARWFYPDSQRYAQFFPKFVDAFAGAAFESGSADCVDDYVGAALWLSAGIHPDETALCTLLQNTIAEPDQADAFALLEKLEKNHPAEPHWYLPMIGVDPALQGNGYGSTLLKHALERCDREDKLAYLESSNPKNISLYERHGFESVGTIQVGRSPTLFPMLRTPRRVTCRG